MGDNELVEQGMKIVAGGISGLVVIVVLNAIFTSPAAMGPDDPLYPVQRSLVQIVEDALPLVVPGAIGVALLLREWLRIG